MDKATNTISDTESLEIGQRLTWSPPQFLTEEGYPELKDIDEMNVTYEGMGEVNGQEFVIVYSENTGLGYFAALEELVVNNNE